MRVAIVLISFLLALAHCEHNESGLKTPTLFSQPFVYFIIGSHWDAPAPNHVFADDNPNDDPDLPFGRRRAYEWYSLFAPQTTYGANDFDEIAKKIAKYCLDIPNHGNTWINIQCVVDNIRRQHSVLEYRDGWRNTTTGQLSTPCQDYARLFWDVILAMNLRRVDVRYLLVHGHVLNLLAVPSIDGKMWFSYALDVGFYPYTLWPYNKAAKQTTKVPHLPSIETLQRLEVNVQAYVLSFLVFLMFFCMCGNWNKKRDWGFQL